MADTEKAPTLDEAVKNAVETNPPTEPEVTKEPEEKKEPEVEEQPQAAKSSFDENEAREAIALKRLLSDPKTQIEAVRLLLKDSGLDLTAKATSSADALATLKEGVPEELHFIIEGLKPAIDKMVKNGVESGIADLRVSAQRQHEANIARDVKADYDALVAKYSDFESHDAAMNELAQSMPMGNNISRKDYMERLYKLATIDKRDATTVKKVVDKINRNSESKAIKSAESADDVVDFGSKLPSIEEAVRFGMQGKRLR